MTQIIPQSSLYKPFADVTPAEGYTGGSTLRNEPFSVQFVIPFPDMPDPAFAAADAYVTIETALPYAAYEVRQVPVTCPTYGTVDAHYARTAPGLYPDPLAPLPENRRIRILRDAAVTIWVTLNPERVTVDAGDYPVKMCLAVTSETGKQDVVEASVNVRVIDAVLPEQSLIYTNWFHNDCLCDRYGCAMFDEQHWALIEKYAHLAALSGMNMILTPCFTPPLDTPVGAERMTAQLIDVEKTAEGYKFCFDKLRRFLHICERAGIRYFEHSHLFTQWGARHAPKVMATVDGEYVRIFGWDTDAIASDGEYAAFLRAYLPALIAVLEEEGIGDRMYFHISDEPTLQHLEAYQAALAIIRPFTEGFHRFDALSSYEFYTTGAVETPVPTTVHADPFLGNVENLWLYYTGFQSSDGCSNRLIALPNARCRAMGLQMWYHDIKGFLQWAYNFWYTRLSERPFDPWSSPDAEGYFVGGTSYMVYPGADGPVPSMRLVSFAEGIDDMRALALYAEKAGRAAAVALMEATLPGFAESVAERGNALHYCPSDEAMAAFREALNRAIAEG